MLGKENAGNEWARLCDQRQNSVVPKLSFVSDNSPEDSIKSFKAVKVGTSWDKDGQLVNLLLDKHISNYEILQNIFLLNSCLFSITGVCSIKISKIMTI